MSNNIKGITIELGGNTGPLTTALKDVNKAAGDAQSELKEINNQLKFDPKNVTLSTQKIDLLKEKSEALENKQKTLKEAVSQAHAAFEKGDMGADKVRAVEREYEKVNSQLKETKKDLAAAETESGKFTEKVKGKFTQLKDKIKDTFSAENIKAGLGAVGVATGAFLKSAIDSATAAQEKTDTLTVLLQNQGETAENAKKTIDQFTSSITKMSAFSGGEAKDALQALTEKGVSSGEALKNSALLADVAAGSHKTLAESAGLLADAYNGKTKALTALGILTKDEAKQLGDSENAAISMTTVQERLNERFGGAAQAQLGTYAGKMQENTNEINSAKTAIGTALLPVLAQIADIAAKVLVPMANFIKENPKLVAAVLAVVAVVGTLVGGMSIFTTVMGFVAAATGTAGVAAGGAAVSFGALLLPITLVIAAIAAVAIGAVVVVKNWSSISAFFVGLWHTIQGLFAGIGQWFKSVFSAGANGVKSAWSGITGFFSGVWNGIKSGASAAWNGIRAVTMAIITPLVSGIIGLWNSVKTGVQTAMNGLKNILGGIWAVIKNVVAGTVLLIIDLVTGNFTKLHDDAVAIFTNLKNTFAQIWTGIQQVFNGFLQIISGYWSAVWGGIQSASINIWNGLVGFFSGLPARIGGIMNSVGSWIRGVWDGLTGFIGSIPGRFASGLSGIGNAVRGAFNGAIGFIKNLPGEALHWGRDIIDGIVNGIKGAVSHVRDAVNGVAQNIRSFLHFSVPDEGPLVDFERWMPDFMKGLATGIRNSTAPVINAAKGVASGIAASIKIPQSITADLQLRTALAATGGSSSVSTMNQPETKKVTQNFYGDIKAAGTGEKNSTLQQLQFISEV